MLNLPFKNFRLASGILDQLKALDIDYKINIMEVCGSHTNAIHKDGINQLLPENIRLISGPGCPVCVTEVSYIDKLISCSMMENHLLVSFGDLSRIPGTHSTLQQAAAAGASISYIYSPTEVLKLAADNRDKKIIFPAIGFETTAPLVASMLAEAQEQSLDNVYILSALKTMPQALEVIAGDAKAAIDGFLLPGHVSSITGAEIYSFLPDKYSKASVISGFEPLDIIMSIFMLVMQIKNKQYKVENQYRRAVSASGNTVARELVGKYFRQCDCVWRGLGNIKNSGLRLKENYCHLDIDQFLPAPEKNSSPALSCRCGDILKGIKTPKQCELFGKDCTPDTPVGACMVSNEGACNSWFKYSVE